MKPSTKNTAKGFAREAKGRVKEAAGAVTGNKTLKLKGKAEATAGHLQHKLGSAERQADRDLSKR
jgi:uncharacterized protein YjbJ (UPF0337 family)